VCARSNGAPSVEELRPRFCTHCGELARDRNGALRVQGHGLYSRQVRGWNEGWIIVWVRRYWCRGCQRTMSRLPDWLHPWRWYAAAVIIEALYRHLILGESAQEIRKRFGRSTDRHDWPSLRRWRDQLLVSATLWGWLGKRLGMAAAVENEDEGRLHLVRFCGEIGLKLAAVEPVSGELSPAVRRTLRGLVHNRRTAWPLGQFRPETAVVGNSGRSSMPSPTEKDAGRDPPA
jgi:hypothetical protein